MVEQVKVEELQALSFLGLMASEGKVPGACSGAVYTPASLLVEEAIREYASDLTAEGDFFQLMVANGQMAAEAPRKKYNIKISRPTNLGGGFGGFGGFGGAQPAH